jgi:2'-5' RNA ligase
MGVYGAIYTLITHIAPCELSTKRFLSYFGETHIALPVEETARTIQMKDLIRRAFQGLSEITHEDESIPHTIVGKIFKDKCDTAWDTIQKIPIQEMTISIKTIELYKKVATQCIWEKIDEFPLRPRTQ